MRTALAAAAAWMGIALSAGTATGSIAGYPFRQLVKMSEIIAEGQVISQIDLGRPGMLGGKRRYTKECQVAVSKVHKGAAAAGDVITLRSHSTFVCDTCRLVKGEKYVFLLKGAGEGCMDINHGQGTWRIVQLGKRQIAVSSGSVISGGYTLAALRGRIAWAMSEPTPRPGKPAVSAQRAEAIARKSIAAAGIDLKGFKLRKVKLLAIGSEIEGFAYKGDPVWLCDWEKPEAKGKSPRPPGTFVYRYVHAQTGAADSTIRKGVSQEDICRLFLKTYGPFEAQFSAVAHRARFHDITEKELRAQAPRAGLKFSRLRPEHPAGTRLFRVDFPAGVDSRSLLLVLYAGRHVNYAGVLPGGKKSSLKAAGA